MRQTSGGMKELFEGDITESDSDSSTKPPETVYSQVSTSRKSPTKQTKPSSRTLRASRSLKSITYAESSSEEEAQRSGRTDGTKKRKRGSSFHESPTKKLKITNDDNARMRSISVGQFFPEASRQIVSPHKPPPSNTASPIKGNMDLLRLLEDPDPGQISGKPLFIRLGMDGHPSLSENDDQAYWWPGKLIDSRESPNGLVELYGDDGHGSSRRITIDVSDSRHCCPMWDPRPPIPRYTRETFQKNPNLLKEAFTHALACALKDDDDDDDVYSMIDGTDDLAHLYERNSTPTASQWRPPSPSPFISLVGHQVLCKSTLQSEYYWPAKVVQYIPPTGPKIKPLLEIQFFDWKTAKLPRECLYTMYDEDERGFAQCKINRAQLSEWIRKNNRTARNEDEEDEALEIDISTLPEPRLPIPDAIAFIDKMTIEEQFAYIIPFLGRILEESYPPSQERIDTWMKGGSSRLGITSNPVQGGHLAEVEWDTFSALVKYWALPGIDTEGQEVPQEVLAGDRKELPHRIETRARPQGSQRYEALSNYEKLMFVHDVLTGEAVIHLLIIRGGHRTNLELLDEQGELELYNIGKAMSDEESTSSVVRNVLERRKDMRKALRMEAETSYEESANAMIDEKEETDMRVRTRASRYAISKI